MAERLAWDQEPVRSVRTIPTYRNVVQPAERRREKPQAAGSFPVARSVARSERCKHDYDYLRTHPCVDCGETDFVVLDFDHQGDKAAEINDMIQYIRMAQRDAHLTSVAGCNGEAPDS